MTYKEILLQRIRAMPMAYGYVKYNPPGKIAKWVHIAKLLRAILTEGYD